jgi:hypothetical protein
MTKRLAIAAILAAACGSSNNTKPDAGKKDAEAIDAPAVTMTVTGQGFIDNISGSGSNQFAFGSATITSLSLNGSSYQAETGVYGDTGAFTIDVVQGDPSYDIGVEFGSAGNGNFPDYIVGDATAPDFSQVFWGRLPVVFPTEATVATINVTGLTQWNAADAIEIMSVTSGAAAFPGPDIGGWSNPTVGSDSVSTSFDFSAQQDLQLTDATQGDVTQVWQLHAATGPDQYIAIANLGSDGTFTQANGSGGTLTAKLAPVTQNETMTVNWKRSQFEALSTQVGTGATDDTSAQFLLIDALPFANEHGDYASAPDLVEFTSPPAGSGDLTETFKYANPFTLNGTALDEFLITRYFFNVPVTAPNAKSSSPVSVGIIEDIPSAQVTGAGSDIVPLVTPVTDVMVNGMALSAPVSGTGTTPTISWTAPTTGTIVGYSVIVDQAANSLNSTKLTELGVLFTDGTSLQIPPGIITTGQNIGYVVIITAYAISGYMPASAPFQNGLPDPQVSMVTSVFQP